MKEITREYLRMNPTHIFVFGDNTLREGRGGAAVLRDEPNTLGFITKKRPDKKSSSYYTPQEYEDVFVEEMKYLEQAIINNSEKIFLISKLGSGLANKYNIWDKVLKDGLKVLKKYNNVVFLYEEE